MPFFSVITPSWNQADFFPACIQSVLTQQDSDFEHLVFDNCSGDRTREIAAGFPHLRFVSEKDRGQSHALNKGLSQARGEIICWLNSDDAYPPGIFARLREVFADPRCQVVFGDVRQISYDGTPPLTVRARFENRLDLVRWWSDRVKLHQPAVFFRASASRLTGLLREDLHYVMDYEYWWRLSERFPFQYLAEVLAIQHRQPDSKTVASWHRVYEEREKVFGALSGLIEGGDPHRLQSERHRTMAENFLQLAWSAPQGSGDVGLNLVRAWREDWTRVARPATLGLLRRLFS